MSSIPIPGTFSHDGMSSSGAIPVVSEVGTTCTNQRVHRSRDPVMVNGRRHRRGPVTRVDYEVRGGQAGADHFVEKR